MALRSLVLYASLATVSLASPARLDERAAPAGVCKAVSNVVKALTAQNSATAFCSSFLGIKTSTVTSVTTTTATQIALTTSTSTATSVETDTLLTTSVASTAVVTAPPSIAIISTATTTTTTVSSSTFIPKVKRDAAPALEPRSLPTPAALKNLASAAISSICGCLSVPTPTVTTTSTATARTTLTNVVVASTTTVSSVQTVSTILATTTTTTTPISLTTTTSTEIDTTTVAATCTTFYLRASSTASTLNNAYVQNIDAAGTTDITLGPASNRAALILSSSSFAYASHPSVYAFIIPPNLFGGFQGIVTIQSSSPARGDITIECSIAEGDGAFRCVETSDASVNAFQYCGGSYYGRPDLVLSAGSRAECTSLTLFAEPAC